MRNYDHEEGPRGRQMNDAIPRMSGPGGGVVPRAQLPGVLLYHGPEESRYVLRRSLSEHLLFHLSSRLPLERSHLTGKGGGGVVPRAQSGNMCAIASFICRPLGLPIPHYQLPARRSRTLPINASTAIIAGNMLNHFIRYLEKHLER